MTQFLCHLFHIVLLDQSHWMKFKNPLSSFLHFVNYISFQLHPSDRHLSSPTALLTKVLKQFVLQIFKFCISAKLTVNNINTVFGNKLGIRSILQSSKDILDVGFHIRSARLSFCIMSLCVRTSTTFGCRCS